MPADLTAITTKVRRLTRSPSPQEISDATIQDYVNTFILYDFPEELRLFEFRTTLTWYCLPFIDTYTTDNTASVPQLVNFDNLYITTHYPMYSAGNKMVFSQKPEEFFNVWPQSNSITQVASGDGVTTVFAGNLTNFGGVPVLRNEVTFSSIDSNNNGLAVYDDGNGNLLEAGNIVGTINYVSGAFIFAYTVAPGAGQAINAMTFPYQPSRPTSLLYYDDQFTLRPVPDQPYPINMEVYIRPTALLQAGQTPKLEQQWQYIAFGASIKIYQDRTDFESANALMPEFKRQELLVQRRSWVQYSNEQVGTIYTNQLLDRNQFGSGNFNFYW
jgi:hypothetical protein